MALVVLFSTMSFTIDMHYCGGTLVDTAIFHKVKTCGMKMQKTSTKKGCNITKKNCCKDEQLVIDGQNELQLSVDKITFEQQIFTALFVCTYTNLFGSLVKKDLSYKDYKPLLVVRQIYKIDQTYLI